MNSYCKNELSDSDSDTKLNIEVNNCKTEEFLEENETVTRYSDRENVLNNYSNYEIYDENNNFMLTNLNEYGFRYYDINVEGEENNFSSEEDLNDNTTNGFRDFFNTSAEETNFKNGHSKELKCNVGNNVIDENSYSIETHNNRFVQNNTMLPNINIEIDNKSKHDQYIENVFFNFLGSKEILEIDIEQSLKCNLIVKETNQTINAKENEKLENIKLDKIDSFVDKSKDCAVESSIDETVDILRGPVTNFSAHQADDSDVCSYHSSDFEFIDESEANEGLVINFNPSTKTFKNINKIETVDISREFSNENIFYDYFHMPGPSVSKNNIPNGDEYANLFLRPCVPYPCRNIENKAVNPMRGVHVVCDGAGFDMKLLLHESDPSDNYKEEADESAKIIVSMYPNENRGIHPRRHNF